MKDWDDEISRALAHPIRRRIVECLHERDELSFTELKKLCLIANHGKLGFHMRALDDLIEREPARKKYHLTDRGRLAGELMWDTRFLMSKGVRGLAHEPARYVRRLVGGDHAILLYDRESFKREISFPFLKAGLLRGEAAVYLASERRLDFETREIIWYGIDVDYFHKKAFTIMSAEEWYLRKGKAQAERIVDNWSTFAQEKMKTGFTGLRHAAEMEVFFDNAKTEELHRYEEALGRQLPSNLCGLCLYDTSRLDEEQFASLTNLHGHSISKGIATNTS